MSEKQWKVVKIVDDYKLVINAGAEQGVSKGDLFEVYYLGEPIYDPDTKENLGSLDYVKCTIKVRHVYPKMSLCENEERQIQQLGNVMSQLFTKDYGPNPIPINAEDISGGYEPEVDDKKVKIGDLVRKSLG